MRYILFLIIPYYLFSKAVQVEEVLPEKNKLKTTVSLAYSNINRKKHTIVPIMYQTTSGDFVSVPTYVGSSSSNQDFVNYSVSLNYGITKNLEVFSNTNFFSSNTRFNDSSSSSSSSSGFNSLNLGFTYHLKHEDKTPALLIGGSTNLLERVSYSDNSKNNVSFKGYSIFALTYYTVDPIVSVSYTHLDVYKRQD